MQEVPCIQQFHRQIVSYLHGVLYGLTDGSLAHVHRGSRITPLPGSARTPASSATPIQLEALGDNFPSFYSTPHDEEVYSPPSVRSYPQDKVHPAELVSPQRLDFLTSEAPPPTPPTAGKHRSLDETPRSSPSAMPYVLSPQTQPKPALVPDDTPSSLPLLTGHLEGTEQSSSSPPEAFDGHLQGSHAFDRSSEQAKQIRSPEGAVNDGDTIATPTDEGPADSSQPQGYVAGAALGAAAAVAGAGAWLSAVVSPAEHSHEDEPATADKRAGEATDSKGKEPAAAEGRSNGPPSAVEGSSLRQPSGGQFGSPVPEPSAEVLMERSHDLGSSTHTEGLNPRAQESKLFVRKCA
jgi:hypothetical protein